MPKKHAGVRKDEKTGKWEVDTYAVISGQKRRFHIRGFDSERDAYVAKVKVINDAMKGKADPLTKNTDFSQLASAYYEHYSSTVKITTAANRKHSFKKYFIEPYNGIPINYAFSIDELKAFKQRLIDAGLSPKWNNEMTTVFKSIANFAYQRGYITAEQFNLTNYELVRVHQEKTTKAEKKTWSTEQYKKFLETFSHDDVDYIMFKLFGQLGCRISELRGLQVKHFLYETSSIRICQQATSKVGGGSMIISPKTAESNRVIGISKELSEQLKDYIRKFSLEDDMFLFPSRTFNSNIPISENSIRRLIERHARMAKIPIITPHGIRHSNTTWLLSDVLSLEDIKKVSKRLGHKDVSMTLNVYFHLHNTDSSDMIKKLDF